VKRLASVVSLLALAALAGCTERIPTNPALDSQHLEQAAPVVSSATGRPHHPPAAVGGRFVVDLEREPVAIQMRKAFGDLGDWVVGANKSAIGTAMTQVRKVLGTATSGLPSAMEGSGGLDLVDVVREQVDRVFGSGKRS
jgi:hypothetical protein